MTKAGCFTLLGCFMICAVPGYADAAGRVLGRYDGLWVQHACGEWPGLAAGNVLAPGRDGMFSLGQPFGIALDRAGYTQPILELHESDVHKLQQTLYSGSYSPEAAIFDYRLWLCLGGLALGAAAGGDDFGRRVTYGVIGFGVGLTIAVLLDSR